MLFAKAIMRQDGKGRYQHDYQYAGYDREQGSYGERALHGKSSRGDRICPRSSSKKLRSELSPAISGNGSIAALLWLGNPESGLAGPPLAMESRMLWQRLSQIFRCAGTRAGPPKRPEPVSNDADAGTHKRGRDLPGLCRHDGRAVHGLFARGPHRDSRGASHLASLDFSGDRVAYRRLFAAAEIRRLLGCGTTVEQRGITGCRKYPKLSGRWIVSGAIFLPPQLG